MSKKKLSKAQEQQPKIEKLKFIETLEDRTDIENATKALKDIKKMDPFLGIK